MALHRVKPRVLVAALLGLGFVMVQAACQPVKDAQADAGGPDVSAVADVDASATLALKQKLLTAYPDQITTQTLEGELTRKAYTCGPDPADGTQRACLSVIKDGVCDVHTIIPTKPYAPNKAQVIRICAVTPS